MTDLQKEVLTTIRKVHDNLLTLNKLYNKAVEEEPQTQIMLDESHPRELTGLDTMQRHFLEYYVIAVEKMREKK